MGQCGTKRRPKCNRRTVYSYAYRQVYITIKSMMQSDEDTVMDLMQDTFLKAFDNLHQLDDPDKFNAWIKGDCTEYNTGLHEKEKAGPVFTCT